MITNIILSLSVVQQNMRLIVLPLLSKALYKFGCFEGILRKAKPRTATEMDGTLHTDFQKSETSRDIKK